MDFPQPDPEQVLQVITNLKAAFQTAADNSTGPSKAKFARLSATFNSVVDKMLEADPSDPKALIQSIGFSFIQLQMAMKQIQDAAKTDPAAAKTLAELTDTIRQESQGLLGGLLGGLGGIGGFDLPDFGGGQKPTPKPPVPKKDPPKKPGDGDWKL